MLRRPDADTLNCWLAMEAGQAGANAMAIIDRYFDSVARGVDVALVRRHVHSSEGALVSGIGTLARFGLLERNGDDFRRGMLALARLRPSDALAVLKTVDDQRRKLAGRDVIEALLLAPEREVREAMIGLMTSMEPHEHAR